METDNADSDVDRIVYIAAFAHIERSNLKAATESTGLLASSSSSTSSSSPGWRKLADDPSGSSESMGAQFGKVLSKVTSKDYGEQRVSDIHSGQLRLGVGVDERGRIAVAVVALGSVQVRELIGILKQVMAALTEQVAEHGDRVGKLSSSNVRRELKRRRAEWCDEMSKASKAARIAGHVDEVKDVLVDNIVVLLDRGERIEQLNRSAAQIEQSAHELERDTQDLACANCRELYCCCCITCFDQCCGDCCVGEH
jgi:Synaptobrevin